MVTVPMYYMLGDVTVLDGQSSAQGYLLFAGDRSLYTGAVANAYTWDADLDNAGVSKQWRSYDAALYSNPCGSASSVPRDLLGPDVGLMPALAAREGVLGAWLVKLIRRGVVGTVTQVGAESWRQAAAQRWTTLASIVSDAHAAIPVFNPQRQTRAIVLGMGWNDGFISATNSDAFYVNVKAFIAELRAFLATGTPEQLPVVATMLRSDRFASTGGQVPDPVVWARIQKCNAELLRIQYEDPFFKVALWGDLGVTTDQNFLAVTGMKTFGQRLYSAYQSIVDAVAPPYGSGVPVYFFVGQSQVEGTVSTDFLIDNDDPRISYLLPPTNEVAWIWNHATQEWQLYNPFSNANSGPYIGPNVVFGPEVTLYDELLKRHERVFLFKVPVPAGPLGDTSTNRAFRKDAQQVYKHMRDQWAVAKLKLAQLGVVPDVRGFFFFQGESDTAEPYATAYEANLRQFVLDVRADFSTRTASSVKLPFYIGKLMQTGSFSESGVVKVRLAQEAVAASDDQVAIVNFDGQDGKHDFDAFPIRLDNVHLAGHGTLNAGRKLAEAVDLVADNMCALVLPTSSSSSSPEVASPEGGGSISTTSLEDNPAALFTVAEFKAHEQISGTGLDGVIAAMADRVASAIDRYCRRVVQAGTHVEVRDGAGSDQLVIRNAPLRAVVEVKVAADGDFAAVAALASTDYAIDASAGILRRRGATWPAGTQNVQVTYDGGFTAIPNAIKQAGILLASYWMGRRRATGLMSQTVGGVTTSWATQGIPDEVASLLNPYRRPSFL